MSFVDKVSVLMTAGDGGDGKLSFRHEKFIDKGGPDGGDGGNGGDIVLKASRNQNTLAAFRFKKQVKAEDGSSGEKRKMHGKSGKVTVVEVPVGTVALNEKGKVLIDLIEDGQEAVIAKGGKGGFGNAHFISSTRQAPKYEEKGEPGESIEVTLELKMIADVGLVGLPNAGKSTFLSIVSNAHPEIANYPFTTLTPNLGVVDVDKGKTVLMADIPGLIEGAAEGKGLGFDFLRHVERTAVILHLIDAYNPDPAKVYQTIRKELEAYSKKLAKKPEIIALTKVEGLDQEIIYDQIAKIKAVTKRTTKIFPISSQARVGVKPMLYALSEKVDKERAKIQKINQEKSIPVIRLEDTSKAYKVVKKRGYYLVTGQNIEKFANRTDFENAQGIQRLRDIMRRAGVMHELERKKIKPGDTVQIADIDRFIY